MERVSKVESRINNPWLKVKEKNLRVTTDNASFGGPPVVFTHGTSRVECKRCYRKNCSSLPPKSTSDMLSRHYNSRYLGKA